MRMCVRRHVWACLFHFLFSTSVVAQGAPNRLTGHTRPAVAPQHHIPAARRAYVVPSSRAELVAEWRPMFCRASIVAKDGRKHWTDLILKLQWRGREEWHASPFYAFLSMRVLPLPCILARTSSSIKGHHCASIVRRRRDYWLV